MMPTFMCYGVLAALVCAYFPTSIRSDSMATSDQIRIKSIEWSNSTVGMMFIIEYKAENKPQIVWGEKKFRTGVDEMFTNMVPYPKNRDRWINSFSNPNGLLILHVPHSFKPRYVFISFESERLSLRIQIDRTECDERGPTGKQMSTNGAVTIKPFGDARNALKNVVFSLSSKRSFHDTIAFICTVNGGHNVSAETIHADKYGSELNGNVYENYLKVNNTPVNSIISIKYRNYGDGPSRVISSYVYRHIMVVRDPEQTDSAASILSSDTNSLPKIPVMTTGFLQCVAVGFPRPTISFMKKNTRIETVHLHDMAFDYVTVAYLEIRNFSLADEGMYRCMAESGISRSHIDLKVSHTPHISTKKSEILTLTKEKVELECVADGDTNLTLYYFARYDGKTFKLDSNTTITVRNMTTNVYISQASESLTRKSAHLVMSNPNMQYLSEVICQAEDSGGHDYNDILNVREIRNVHASFHDRFRQGKTAHCSVRLKSLDEEAIPDVVTIEWYKNEVKAENRIYPDVNTIIVAGKRNSRYDRPRSYLFMMDKIGYKPLGYDIICRAYTRFKEHHAVVKDKPY